MDIRVGDVWESGTGKQKEIVKTDGATWYYGVTQPIESQDGGRYTAEGWFGRTEEAFPADNLVRLVSRAEETTEETTEETILPGEEFGEEKFEIARAMQDAGTKFEYWNSNFEKWVRPVGREVGFYPVNRYRIAEPPKPEKPVEISVNMDTPSRPLRLMIVGHGRHGKDTVANMLSDELSLTFCSSSWYCAKAFVFDALRVAFGYESLAECYEDRTHSQEMRDLWHTLISAYNSKDPARLSREIFAENDIYVGIRSQAEFLLARREGLFDLTIWVDASGRLSPEGASSFEISPEDCDIILDNNSTEGDLEDRVVRLARVLKASL